jgi:hypothetical protein
MSDDKPHLDPTKALADIQVMVRSALESADPVVMRHNLEMILLSWRRLCRAGQKTPPKRSSERDSKRPVPETLLKPHPTACIIHSERLIAWYG